MPLTYNGERKWHFPKVFENILFWRQEGRSVPRERKKECVFGVLLNMCEGLLVLSMCYSENVVKCSQNRFSH